MSDNLARLRLRIADRPRYALHELVGAGDGLTLGFRLTGAPVVSGSVQVIIIAADSTTAEVLTSSDYDVDLPSGILLLRVAPVLAERVQVSYSWSVFSDAELLDVLVQVNDDVARATALCLTMLLADADRFLKYTLGQEQVDRSAAREALQAALDELRKSTTAPRGLVWANDTTTEALLYPFAGSASGYSAEAGSV